MTPYETMIQNQAEVASIRGVLDAAGHAIGDGNQGRAVELLAAAKDMTNKLLSDFEGGTSGL